MLAQWISWMTTCWLLARSVFATAIDLLDQRHLHQDLSHRARATAKEGRPDYGTAGFPRNAVGWYLVRSFSKSRSTRCLTWQNAAGYAARSTVGLPFPEWSHPDWRLSSSQPKDTTLPRPAPL